MKRKMLISISLLIVMILNCIMPLFVVNAAEGEEIQLNSKLYFAVKKSLAEQKISFYSNDITHTLTVNDITSVKRLDLQNGGITFLTGLDSFTSLEHLELSGNNISKESDLGVLNNLQNLNYLDLSTNHLSDISKIENLKNKIKSEKGTFIITGQTMMEVQSVYIDTSEDSNNEETAEFELPPILNEAGFIKANWKIVTRTQEPGSDSSAPYIDFTDVPMYVNSETNKVTVHIADENGNGYYGLVKLYIHIYDDATEAGKASNENPAAKNALNGSEFELYYVVYKDSCEAITTMDTNLYNAIKEQLTGGQEVNPDLTSYPYAVDEEGNLIYETFFYDRIESNLYYLYLEKDSNENPIYLYVLDTNTGVIKYYNEDESGNVIEGEIYSTGYKYGSTEIKTIDNNGVITYRDGFILPAKAEGEIGKNMYVAAYDDAKTFVIYDSILTNKITSLILNNKQIRDLSGLEYFIGLTSNLNVSHNYLSNIDPIYNLDEQKDFWEAQMKEEYNYWLKEREYGNLASAIAKTKDMRDEIAGYEDDMKNIGNSVIAALREAAQYNPEGSSPEDIQTFIDESVLDINKKLDPIYGYYDEDGNYVKGFFEEIKSLENELQAQIAANYSYLATLYDIYNNEYKLTSLLSDSLNYITLSEYQEYYDKTHGTRDEAMNLLKEQIEYVKTLENNNALSDLDKALLAYAFGVDFSDPEEEKPVAKRFDDILQNEPQSRSAIVNSYLNVFREIAIYSEMANYCLIKRMNEVTASGYCYEENYLKNRIKEFTYDDIPTDLEQEILETLQDYMFDPSAIIASFMDVYYQYKQSKAYTSEDGSSTMLIKPCDSEYVYIDNIKSNGELYPTEELISKAVEGLESYNASVLNSVLSGITNQIYKKLVYNEVVLNSADAKYYSENNKLFLYDQMVSLANKLIGSNTERYILLARLKKLDVSYNADLDNLEGITVLADTLSDLNAAYCYIADISNIDWSVMKNLKRLNLAYNYISDISPLKQLENLQYLNLSNNLLSGELDIQDTKWSIFKKLKDLDLSGNQLTDISSLLRYLNHITGGNYANYLAREDTLNVNLSGQNIVMEVEEPISLEEHPTTFDLQLPPIFNQLLDIDVNRTGFGVTSQNGRIESEGTYVTLNTRTAGDKVGTVVVLPMNGNGMDVDTCIGEGTTATIKYKVVGEVVPVNPTDPTDPTDPTNPTDPTDPTNPTDPTDPTDPSNPTDPSTPADPTEHPKVNITLGYNKEDTMLTNVKAKTPLDTFKNILLNGENYNVVVISEGDENKEVTSGYIGTGMLVKIQDDQGRVLSDQDGNLLVYEVIVKGDVNGDGTANSLDSILIKAHRNEVIQLTGYEYSAADINSDGNVNTTDARLLLYHRAEVTGYSLNYNN